MSAKAADFAVSFDLYVFFITSENDSWVFLTRKKSWPVPLKRIYTCNQIKKTGKLERHRDKNAIQSYDLKDIHLHHCQN